MLTRIKYKHLNSRQKENYNFQKLSSALADYGFVTHRLSDDWNGADLIAHHVDGVQFLKIQLKSRFTVGKKYRGKDLHVAFPYHGHWYLYPHDAVLDQLLDEKNISQTKLWNENGIYHYSHLNDYLKKLLASHQLF